MSARAISSALIAMTLLACSSDERPGTVAVGQDSTRMEHLPAVGVSVDGGASRGLPSVSSGPMLGASHDAAVVGFDAGSAQAKPDSGTLDAAALSAFSCVLSSDCIVKDVGSCCGYYPRCANLGATFGPPNCNVGQVGVCGFPVIDHCECQRNTCVGVQSAVQGSQQF